MHAAMDNLRTAWRLDIDRCSSCATAARVALAHLPGRHFITCRSLSSCQADSVINGRSTAQASTQQRKVMTLHLQLFFQSKSKRYTAQVPPFTSAQPSNRATACPHTWHLWLQALLAVPQPRVLLAPSHHHPHVHCSSHHHRQHWALPACPWCWWRLHYQGAHRHCPGSLPLCLGCLLHYRLPALASSSRCMSARRLGGRGMRRARWQSP